MAKGCEQVPITVDVVPNLSRFRQATVEEIVDVLRDLVKIDDIYTPAISEANCRGAAKAILDHFVVLPR